MPGRDGLSELISIPGERVPGSIPPPLRDDLQTYLFCTSPDRARISAELLVRNPGMGELLADLEADDELRARLEIELLNGVNGGGAT